MSARYRFDRRVGTRYYWYRSLPNDSRSEVVSCDVAWFWGWRKNNDPGFML